MSDSPAAGNHNYRKLSPLPPIGQRRRIRRRSSVTAAMAEQVGGGGGTAGSPTPSSPSPPPSIQLPSSLPPTPISPIDLEDIPTTTTTVNSGSTFEPEEETPPMDNLEESTCEILDIPLRRSGPVLAAAAAFRQEREPSRSMRSALFPPHRARISAAFV